MGVSIFVLIMFCFNSIGLAGMCSGRMHNTYNQTCHRGISANFFMTAVGLFFIFSWALILVCIFLYVPGVMLRHTVCKPLIELEDNQLFHSIKNFEEFHDLVKKIQFKNVLRQCSQSDKQQNDFRSKLYSLFQSELLKNQVQNLKKKHNKN